MFNEIYQEAYLEKLASIPFRGRLATLNPTDYKRAVDAGMVDHDQMLRGIQKGNRNLIKKYNLNVVNKLEKVPRGNVIRNMGDTNDELLSKVGPLGRKVMSKHLDVRNIGPLTGLGESGKQTQILMQNVKSKKINKIFKNTTRAQMNAEFLRHEIDEAREGTRKGMVGPYSTGPTKSQRGMSKEELIRWRRGRSHLSPEVLKREQQVAARLGPGPLANINTIRAKENKTSKLVNKGFDAGLVINRGTTKVRNKVGRVASIIKSKIPFRR